MRTLCKSFIVLVALMIPDPALLAQTVNPELYQLSNGIGYNKYLTSTMPNANGEYTLRLESFVTASVATQDIPTDFVIVIDATGSMQWDFSQPGDLIETRNYITEAENNALPDWQKLKSIAVDDTFKNYTRFTWSGEEGDLAPLVYGYMRGNYGDSGSGGSSPPLFLNEASRWYWHAVDRTFYRIRGEVNQKPDESKYYNLFYNRRDGEKRYLDSYGDDGIHDRPESERRDDVTGQNCVILNVENDKDRIFRPGTRRDVELMHIDDLIDQIKVANASLSVADRHTLALVSFEGNLYSEDNPTEPQPSTDERPRGSTQVLIKGMKVASDSDKQELKRRINLYPYWGSSVKIQLGVWLAKLLLKESMENQQSNRNKVVILFTDGKPSNRYEETVSQTLDEGYQIKTSDDDGTVINGKIFTVDLSNSNKTPDTGAFIEHLSSNYPDGSCTVPDGVNTSTWENITYHQNSPTETGYYMSAASMDLQKAFGYTATAATGPRIGSQLVIVDRMSDNFVLPSGSLTEKVKFYTAQCIGTKTISGGTSNLYLAFAEPVQANTRSTLNHLWVSSGSGTGTSWTDVGSLGNETLADIDNNITYTVSSDRKTITIKGFKFSDLWCGQDVANDNTRHTVSSSDPNYNNQQFGYRGFKLIAEIPVVPEENAVGGPHLSTNNGTVSGVYNSTNGTDPEGSPLVTFPVPELSIPVRFVIQKTGLAAGESASFTLQRKLASGSSSTYSDYATFILTGDGTTTPEVKIMHLDPAYHYCVKETGWSWSYTIDSTVFSTEQGTGLTRVLTNPIVFTNSSNSTAKHGEDKVTNNFPETTP